MEQPSGYTEPLLHAWRQKAKANASGKLAWRLRLDQLGAIGADASAPISNSQGAKN
jgi:hypothetical protein